MGTKVHCETHTPGYYSIREMNEDSSSSIWSPFHGNKNLLNGQYCNGFIQRTVRDEYPEYEKDVLKQKMIEHETLFKKQVYELHRVYKVQREMMEEAKRRELYNHHRSIETTSSSSILPSQMPSDEVRNWQKPSFPLASCARPSILGSEVIDSPSSYMKGRNSEADLVPYQNKCDQKELALLDSRPLKDKKKMFDHQIPADKYIVTEKEERFQNIEVSNTIFYPTSGNHRLSLGNSIKKYPCGGKTNDLRDTVSLHPKIPMLADLNEPIQVEECDSPKIVDVSGCSAGYEEIRVLDHPAKMKSQFVDLSQDFLQNSQRGSSNGYFSNISESNKGTRRGWLSSVHEAGNRGADANCIPKFHQSEQLLAPSQQIPLMPGKPNRHQGILPTDYAMEEAWTERSRSYDFSNISCGHSNYNQSESVVTHISKPYQWHNSSNATNSWSNSVTSWGKPKSILIEKVTSLHTRPSETSSRDITDSSRLNPGLESKLPTQNGSCPGSSLVSKELSTKVSSYGYNDLKCNEIDVVASKHLTKHGFKNVVKDSDVKNLKSVKDLDLNVVLPTDPFNEEPLPRSNEILDGKRKFDDHYPDLPWLRRKPLYNDMSTITRKDLESGLLQAINKPLLKDETVKGSYPLSAQNVLAASSSCHVSGNRESASGAINKGKLLGFPIFGNFCTSKNDSTSVQSSCNGVSTKNGGDHRGIDINVACDLMDADFNEQIVGEATPAEKGNDTEFNNFRNIDLNSCVSEDENSSLATTGGKVKIAFEIDLEAPAVLKTTEAFCPVEEQKQHEASSQPQLHKTEQQEDQVVKNAAEAIVAISSYNQDPNIECTKLQRSELPESLTWFANVISSSGKEFEKKLCHDSKGRNGRETETPRELDDYEAMTLQLTETREEDYMPEPFIPEIPNLQEVGATSVPSRTRKGPARRGRMRKDFQRDVLPGLVSLSRHEVIEDLQTFGGLMRATGHQWNGGTTRRNGTRSGAARGRRRSIIEPSPAIVVAPVCKPSTPNFNSTEVRVEDISLAGWGKTTRRPRRQRNAAANNLAVAMT